MDTTEIADPMKSKSRLRNIYEKKIETKLLDYFSHIQLRFTISRVNCVIYGWTSKILVNGQRNSDWCA